MSQTEMNGSLTRLLCVHWTIMNWCLGFYSFILAFKLKMNSQTKFIKYRYNRIEVALEWLIYVNSHVCGKAGSKVNGQELERKSSSRINNTDWMFIIYSRIKSENRSFNAHAHLASKARETLNSNRVAVDAMRRRFSMNSIAMQNQSNERNSSCIEFTSARLLYGFTAICLHVKYSFQPIWPNAASINVPIAIATKQTIGYNYALWKVNRSQNHRTKRTKTGDGHNRPHHLFVMRLPCINNSLIPFLRFAQSTQFIGMRNTA